MPRTPRPASVLDGRGHPVERPATEVDDRHALRQGRQHPDRVAERSAGAQVRIRQERQQSVRRRDRLVARGCGDAATPGQEHDGVERHRRRSAAAPRSPRDGRGAIPRVSTLDGPAMMRSKKASPSSARLGLRSDTRRGAGRAAPAATSRMAMSSPSSVAPRAQSAHASVDLPASPRPASRRPRPSRTTRAPCTITASDSAIAATALYSTAVTARAALGSSTSIPAEDRTRHAGPAPLPSTGSTRQEWVGTLSSWLAQGWKTVAARPPDGGIVGLEREGERPCRPADGPAGGRHDAGTIAPWRVSSSRNAATSLRSILRAERRELLTQRRGEVGQARRGWRVGPRGGCRLDSGRARCETSGDRGPRGPRRLTPRHDRISRRRDRTLRSRAAGAVRERARMLPTGW